ncbi:uncharacterized protein LOC141614038 [Silene latifolia]|uniref:uncharacterized protein LOC141614038 n=1 Tax=Silene latifolia TaxID=37657 RepID=UPI003D77086C
MPNDLRMLFMSNDAISINFRKYVMLYNSSFAFTSFGVKKDRELAQTNRGVYTFRVQGQIENCGIDLIYDEIEQNVIRILMRVMEMNPYTQFFRSLREVGIDEESRILIKSDPIQDQRTHNTPTASQVAAIWVDDENSSHPPRHDIVIYAVSGTSHRILHYYGCYDPLQYPLLFPFGESGWHRRIYRVNSHPRRRPEPQTFLINEVLIQTTDDLLESEEQVAGTSASEKKVSCREYYCYRLQIRPNDSSILLRSGRLLQQYTVDIYNSGYTRGANIGHIFILPASFIGCDRDFRRRYPCSMAVVQRYGKPDIFLTMTCNPRWPEIERELLPCEEAQNRPDLVSRVFRSKIFELKKDICVRKIFGNAAGYVYVVEFQKRGLPHAHFLIILDSESKIRTPDEYDEFVSAKLPDATENPHLFSAVVRHMMHGPCGRQNPDNPCMINGTCKNHYPREFADTTTNDRDSYPIYRRRRTSVQVTVRKSRLNNRWVVSYNPFLLAKYDCHLNVEICCTIKAVKYMYKYVYKGHDRISFAVTDPSGSGQESFDEITAYQSARWISPPEAAWRIFGFHLNEIHPNVVHLQVHLPNMQTVSFQPWENLGNVLDGESRNRTMLTAFFKQNETDTFSQTLLYSQLPEYYVWHNRRRDRFWTPREKGFALGHLCLAEAVQYQMPAALRRLFATLLIYYQPNNPRLLWDKFYTSLSEDYAYDFPAQRHKVLQMTVTNVCCILESMGKSFSNFKFGDLNFCVAYFSHSITKEIKEELNIPISSEDINAVNMLNEEQRPAYDTIDRRVTENGTGSFFLDGPGGTGKTFLYTTLLANLRARGLICLAVASSGIAAANLPGGKTSNSRFKIPLDIENNQSSQISKQSPLAELIQSCKLIVWDEAPMAKRQSIEYFEKTLRDVCSSTEMFGGKIIVFGGDFRQDVKLPRSIVISGTEETTLIEQLIDTIYPDIQRLNINLSLTTKRAILTPKNDDAQMINSILVSRQEGEPFTYRSFDEATDVATEQYPVEFLNTLQPSGLPPHELVLKINSPIILLRNLDPTSGLCNGTRLICKAFDRNVIDAEIVVGHHKGRRVFIPRISLQPSPSDKFPFQFRRKKFPIRLSFAMTINKA